jgi:methylated-DNA-[protein]-cysteine S-methyltransferase
MIAQHIIDTPLGWMLIEGGENEIYRSFWINEEDAVVGASRIRATWLKDAENQFKEYFAGERDHFNLPLGFEGSSFQKQIWTRLLDIAAGTTTTYGQIAEEHGNKNLSQAVGGAVGANPLLVIIPCHRVIGADDSLTGYAGGIQRKQFLLEHEGAFHPEQLRLF